MSKERKLIIIRRQENNLKNKEKDKNKKWSGCTEDCKTRFGSDANCAVKIVRQDSNRCYFFSFFLLKKTEI